MSSRIFSILFILFLVAPGRSSAQNLGERPAEALAPSLTAAALFPHASLLEQPFGEILAEPLTIQAPASPGGSSFVVTAIVLAGASLGGLWAGRQIPLPPADDDSDLSVLHLITSPVASIVTVAAASALLGNGLSPTSAFLGAAAGAAAGLVANMGTTHRGVVITYVGVHGLVTALMTR